jgi:hypothetical protein
MNRWIRLALLAGIHLAVFCVQTAQAQGIEQTAAPQVVLDLASSGVTPGGIVAVRVTLSTDMKIRDALLRITFPKASLSFVRDERGAVARRAGATLASTDRPAGDEKSSVLEVRISAPREMAPGILAYLHFRVHETVKAGELVILKNEPVEVMSADGQKYTKVGGANGQIIVVSPDLPPLFSCFFYMH